MIGVGKDSPTTENSEGGRQSKIDYRFDLIPAEAIAAVAAVLAEGAVKYGVDNWRKIAAGDHLNHAMMHIFAHMSSDTQDEHAEHAATRILMWLELLKTNGADKPVTVDDVPKEVPNIQWPPYTPYTPYPNVNPWPVVNPYNPYGPWYTTSGSVTVGSAIPTISTSSTQTYTSPSCESPVEYTLKSTRRKKRNETEDNTTE